MSQSSVLLEERKGSRLTELSAQQRPEVSAIFRALGDDKSLTFLTQLRCRQEIVTYLLEI